MIFYIPATAPVVLAIVIPVGVISLYLHRKSKTEGEGTGQRAQPAASARQQQPEEMQVSTEATSSPASKMDAHTTRPDVLAQPLPSLSAPRAQAEKGRDSVENLQARINELEERVRWLRERLATGLPADTITVAQAESDGKSPQTSGIEGTEELSERALQQLLEALDEKLAKGTISQQLYQRLRDKYLARLSKARGKREAAPQAVSSKPRRRR